MSSHDDNAVRIATVVCLTVIIVCAIAGITLVAIFTDRDLTRAEVFTLIAAAWLALLGGVHVWELRHRRRWRLEREELSNGNHSSNQ